MYNYVGIVVNNSSLQTDKIFTYKIPDELIGKINIGQRVKVGFGKGNKLIDGFILEFYDRPSIKGKIKEIHSTCENFSLITSKDVELIKIMRERYLCTYIDAIKVFIPKGIIQGNSHKIVKLLYCNKPLEGKYSTEKYIAIYDKLKQNEGKYNKTQFCRVFNFSLSSVNTLIKNGYLQTTDRIVNRFNNRKYKKYEAKLLTEQQKFCVRSILEGQQKKFLLHGVTGSGKTEIYMNLVSEMISQDKQSIILVPEIALTPQMVERFKGRFGENISVFHSKLSDGEKYDEWIRIKKGEVKVAIGARSAIFLPFNNLGLIVIDEEHVESYKSDSNPKYHAREIAFLKSELYNCKVVLGTATPSVETYYKSKIGNIELLKINKRIGGVSMPEVNIIDMREELFNNNKSIFSRELLNGINEALLKKEQIILFLNRRGFSPFVSCRKCGYVFTCDNCDISLTYHSHGDYLSCHYCGKKIKMTRVCPKCGSKYVKHFGIGTEKIEEEVRRLFPHAVTLRMDLDTTRKKNSHENIYNAFKNREADILIGTQMISKGLDFENVTLVGVIAADLSLNLPDYRSNERTYQLITQVAGRAGRGEKNGRVVIQTYSPENFSIKCAATNEYEKFFLEEISYRKTMNYPPFSKIMLINLSSENEKMLIDNSNSLGNYIKNRIERYDNIDMLGPVPCSISKIKNNYRWQIILKGEIKNNIANEIRQLVYKNIDSQKSLIKVGIDINPSSLI